MAYELRTQGPGSVLAPSVLNVPGPVPPIRLADQAFPAVAGTGSRLAGGIQDLGFECSLFRVVVYLKTFVLGSSSAAGSGPHVTLEASNVANMASGIVSSGIRQFENIASATQPQCMEFTFRTPTGGKRYCRLVVDSTLATGGSMAGVYDALIEAVP